MDSKQYVASLSYGKDSMAMLHVIKDVLDWPLDRIITADVWATDTISADLPSMVEFKAYADEEIKKRWGINVEHINCNHLYGITKDKVTYEDVFYRKKQRGKYTETGRMMYGFPIVRGPWCQKLKVTSIDKITKDGIQYLGIAFDEPNRFHNASEMKKLPLVEAEWTEQMCRDWCEQNDLLSPIYTTSARGGCWFCHNQGVNQLRILRHDYPDLWGMLLQWDNDSPVTFHADGRTVHDFEKRFRWEDEGYKPTESQFRWADVENPQMNIEQYLNSLEE